jgi:enoyl-CoA hydratase/carnithine racemase
MTDKIITEHSGGIARIIFNQPEQRNAVLLGIWRTVEAAEETAKMISANAPRTLASVKPIAGETDRAGSARDLDACDRRAKACFDSKDPVESRQAFLEKRKPSFVGA